MEFVRPKKKRDESKRIWVHKDFWATLRQMALDKESSTIKESKALLPIIKEYKEGKNKKVRKNERLFNFKI
jgi:hypothetical protein